MPTPMQKLEAERDMLQAKIDALEEGFTSLMAYMASPKFHGAGNNHVNTDDIVARIREIRSNVADVEMLPWGQAHPIKGHYRQPSAWDYGNPMDKHSGCCGEREYNPNIDPFTGEFIPEKRYAYARS